MRILMVNHFPLEGSGSGTYTKNLAMQLAARGHEVRVVLPETDVNPPRYEGVGLRPVLFAQDGLPSTDCDASAHDGRLPFGFPCFTTHPRSQVTFDDLSDAQMQAYLGAFEAAIADEVANFRPDVVHGQHLWCLTALASRYGVPTVATAHGTDLMGCQRWPHLSGFADQAASTCQRIICISQDNERLVISQLPAYADKVVRMSNGYNPAIFFPQKLDGVAELARFGIDVRGKRIALFAGKLTEFKGVDVVVDAAARLLASAPDVVVPIAGDGVLRDSLEARAVSAGARNVHFLGNVSQDQLCRLYNVADVSLVPSRREPFGLVAVEAMACGTPVVATNEGGLPDFVNDGVGALVGADDADALARAIVGVLDRSRVNPQWRDEIAAYATAHYSQAATIGDIEALYQSIQGACARIEEKIILD